MRRAGGSRDRRGARRVEDGDRVEREVCPGED